MLVGKNPSASLPQRRAPRPVERAGTWGLRFPRAPRFLRAPAHTQARVELAGIAVLLPQVRAVRVQLPRVPEVLHQGLYQARGRAEVVALVAVEVPAQAAGPPGVDRGQLRGERPP